MVDRDLAEMLIDDLGPKLLKAFRSLILRMGQTPHPVAASQRFLDRCAAAVTRRSGDQDFALDHTDSPSFIDPSQCFRGCPETEALFQ
jgi:hypothetical protein